MKPRLARALLVFAVFGLLAALSATASYVSGIGKELLPARFESIPSPEHIFLSRLRYYVAWALVAPGILWLGRRVPLRRHGWFRPLAFHVVVPVVGSLPFLLYQVALSAVLGAGGSWWELRSIPWRVLFPLQLLMVLPVYWLLLALGAALQFSREYTASELRAVNLRRSLTAAQLDALKMKLQPHFLFNTLNAIASLAQSGETDAVVRVVERLATLLRLSMETSGRQFVTLEEELALLDEYLAIEEMRFKDRLRILRRIAPEARKALVPNLILQPLIENALEHGLGRRLDASVLEIAARRDGADLRIAVRDDGPGLPAGWNLAADAGPGLKNVDDRLRGLYADACRFEVQNGATGGTLALLSVPFTEGEPVAAGSPGHG
jgi:sensor histidine kinase YesM